jgi:hydroxymethylglutaryl-CoA lyase
MREVFIHEVGLRDGLQIEKSVASTDVKLRWIEKLGESGVDVIQVGSFVNPDRVPQMADTDLLFRELGRRSRASRPALSALVLNEKGLHRGLDVGVEFFCMGVSASDTHSRKNTGMSTEEATNRIVAMAHQAQAAGARVQVSVQSAFGCGFEGLVPVDRVIEIVERFLEAGLGQISLADTAGHAHPSGVRDLFGEIRDLAPESELACHFHDTYGLAMANCYAALEAGVRWFESAFGGLGGCPFTALSGGNVSTEDLVHMFQRMRLVPDIRLQPIFDVVAEAEQLVGRVLPGAVHRTGVIPSRASALATV